MREKILTFLSPTIVLILYVAVTPIWTLTVQTDDFNTTIGRELLKRSKAADVKSWMDTGIEPCQDFYNFACGKWHHINSAQSVEYSSRDQFSEMARDLHKKAQEVLRGDVKTGGGPIEDKLKKFYESCMKAEGNNVEYLTSLKAIYQEFGEFSAIKSMAMPSATEATGEGNATASSSSTDPDSVALTTSPASSAAEFVWWSSIAKIQNLYGKPIILSIDVLDDLKNNNRTMIYLGPPAFAMTQTAPSITQRDNIQHHIMKYLALPAETAKEMATNLMDFEFRLSFGATDTREGKTTEEKLTLYNSTDLKEQYRDLFDLEKLLTVALDLTELPAEIYVFDKSYLENLVDVFNRTNPSIVEDYILWLLLEEYFINSNAGTLDEWCTEKSKKYFGKFIDHTIYQGYRSEEYEKEIYHLWDEIKATFRDNLKGNKYDWMSNRTREYALEKLNKMNMTINSYENENFELFYKDLQINASNYISNIDNIRKHVEALRTNKMEKQETENHQELAFTPVYNSFTNSIKIPVALLQPYRVWNPLYPKAIKYATLGFLLAHEMIHGFDDQGRHYDGDGKLFNWWDDLSAHHFESRRRCFQAQYHNYSYAGYRLPDSIPQHENIADNAAVKIAYQTYVRWLKLEKATNYNIEVNETFPNLDYNNRELFFLSFAQLWCEDVQMTFRSFLAFVDIHAPSMYRVIGSLANFHDFSWIFKCDLHTDTLMNPSTKCDLY